VTSNPARMLNMQDSIGTLLPGREADISVLDLLRGRFTLSDNSGEKVIAQEMLTPAFAIRVGKLQAADSALIPPPALLAA
jgi:dihydroorotase